MIATKQKKSFICTSCNQSYPAWRGKCLCGLWNTIEEVAVVKKAYHIPKISPKRQIEIAESKKKLSDLDIWFNFQKEYELSNGNGKCENCGTSVRNMLNSKDDWMWKSCFGHILPKKTFKSVATNINNFAILCLPCHQNFDSSWMKAMTMPVFKKAKEKFKLFQHLITESTTHLPNELIN